MAAHEKSAMANWPLIRPCGATFPQRGESFRPLPLQLLAVVLQRVQLVISAVLRQKLLMAALLKDPAVGQHDDVVRVLDGGQPVGYNQHCADSAARLRSCCRARGPPRPDRGQAGR